MRRRWDIDERGHGVASAERSVPDLDRLRAATVTHPRVAAFAILGTFAESSTHVVEASPDIGREVVFGATTGVLDGDGPFAPHGHTARIRVRRS